MVVETHRGGEPTAEDVQEAVKENYDFECDKTITIKEL